MHIRNRIKGFSLLELVIVIVITAILSAIIATFIKQPIDAYVDSVRRAALTDEADTVIRRMARDIRKALPNSVRTSADRQCIEFIPTKTGGRYRAQKNDSGNGDPLDFTTADTSFDMFGLNSALPTDQQIQTGDVIAVYNLGIAGASAYNADNTSIVVTVGTGDLPNETKIIVAAPKQFPLASGSKRFQIIPGNENIVSFVCNGGTLYRNSNYGYAISNSCPATGGAILAQHVSSCDFAYDNSNPRNALVQIAINLTTDGGETVRLYHEAHIGNSP